MMRALELRETRDKELTIRLPEPCTRNNGIQPKKNLLRTADTESVRRVPERKTPKLTAFYFRNCSRFTKMDRPRWLAVSMEYDTAVDACGTGCRPRHSSAGLILCFTVTQGEINTLQSNSGSRTRYSSELCDSPGCKFRE